MKSVAPACLLLGALQSCQSTPSGAPKLAAAAPGVADHAAAASAGSWTPKILRDQSPYLPDFSYAGYRAGEAPPPDAPVTHSIRDFGALPDDEQDDTAAFKSALSKLGQGKQRVVLSLAAGRYILSDVLFIERGDFVLRGAGSGPGGTLLELKRPLAELPRAPVISELEQYLRKNNKLAAGKPFSPFSWTGGLIWTRLATKPALAPGSHAVEGRRGLQRLRVAGVAPEPGSLIELRWVNRFGSQSPVLGHVFGLSGRIAGERLADPEQPLTAQLLHVTRREGDSVWLEEPLRHDVRPEWSVTWAPAAARLSGVGIEHLRIALPNEAYAGHHLERGYNALYLTDLRDSFVRDVVIHNADSAILSDDSDHVTLSGVQLTGRPGHYGIHLGDVESVLVKDFAIEARYEHSLSFNTGARGSVFSQGRIENARLDQHRGRNHQNLFDAIVAVDDGPTSALLEHGGADYWGPAHGAFNTFWNIQLTLQQLPAARSLVLSGVDDAGPARLVGISANLPLRIDYPGAYQEGVGEPGIAIPSLYDEQLRRRIGRQ